MRTLCLLILVSLAVVFCEEDPFIKFTKEWKKIYMNKEEETMRREIFMEKYNDMMEHNAKYESGEVSWARKVTENYDRTPEEYAEIRPRGIPKHDNSTGRQADRIDDVFMEKLSKVAGTAPSSWDWRLEGGVTSVKSQGQCGSCHAFSSMAVVETCFWQQTNIAFDDLSEQFLLDCAYGYEVYDSEEGWTLTSEGCQGGWAQVNIDWLINSETAEGWTQVEGDYPYAAQDQQCRPYEYGWYNKAYVSGMYHKWYPNEEEMVDLVYMGPIETSIIATYLDDYSHGVFDDSRCCEGIYDPDCRWKTDHSVTLVGYGRQNGLDYWIVKNSWGDWWGDRGYMKIKRGTGHCGIGNEQFTAAYCKPLNN